MFDRFTDKSVKALVRAEHDARRLGLNYVGVDQILLALIETGGVTEALESVELTKNDLQQKLTAIICRGTVGFVFAEVPFTFGAQRVFKRAQELAQRSKQTHVAPEHLLLAILDAGSETIFATLGIDSADLRKKIFLTKDARY